MGKWNGRTFNATVSVKEREMIELVLTVDVTGALSTRTDEA